MWEEVGGRGSELCRDARINKKTFTAPKGNRTEILGLFYRENIGPKR